ncbi:MAG: fused MFS/spermidine synthase, partial [Nitrospirae bacterium]|nr:fused MFS/spermidine synthase [Nitrospirota bacterium]
MAAELIGAKLVAPYYGSSLYVWAAVLAITLGGLATGYFLGGIISARYPHRKTLYRIMLASSVLVALMPQTAVWILEATLDLEIRVGITLSCLVFLFPPLILFGMVSPLIVRLITFHEEKIG